VCLVRREHALTLFEATSLERVRDDVMPLANDDYDPFNHGGRSSVTGY
jgi:hypothetical protein